MTDGIHLNCLQNMLGDVLFKEGVSLTSFVIKSAQSQLGDQFDVPGSACRNITDKPKCLEYGATNRQLGSPCQCKCPPMKSSFIYRGGKWNCTDDLTIRKQENCAVHAGLEDPLTEQLRPRGEGQVLMWNIRTKAGSNITCEVDTKQSTFMSCFDGWKPITETGRIKVFVDSSTAHLRILSSKSGELDGRIVKVVFNSGCAVSTNGSPCLLFKLEGQANCPYEKLLPILPSSSSVVAQQTSSVSAFIPISRSSPIPSFAEAVIRTTSTSTAVLPDIQASTTNDYVSPTQVGNSTKTFLSEARSVHNDNTFLYVGLCVAPLFIFLMVIIVIITCHRCRASRRGVIQFERGKTSDSVVHLDQFFAGDYESESTATQSDEEVGLELQNLGHITLFCLETQDVTEKQGKEELPRVYACVDDRFKTFAKPKEENDGTFAMWEDVVPTFSTFLDSFQKKENIESKGTNSNIFVNYININDTGLINDGKSYPPSPLPPYGYEKRVDDEEEISFNNAFPDKSRKSRNYPKLRRNETSLNNSDWRRSHSPSKQETRKETWEYEIDGEGDASYTYIKLKETIPRSSVESASKSVNKRDSVFSVQKFDGMPEVAADLTFDVPSNGYPLYDFSFELVTE